MVNHTLTSMTGFASHRNSIPGYSWAWEMRAVNAKGLDVRLRVPDWIDGLEQALKPLVTAAVGRGSVTVTLRLARDERDEAPVVRPERLEAMLAALSQIEEAALKAGVVLAPTTGGEILTMKSVLDTPEADDDQAALTRALLKDFQSVIGDFNAMRAAEGAALGTVLARQIDEIESLTAKATTAAEARRGTQAETLRANLARVLDAVEADPDRVAQELALLAVKSDITEELDRLAAHVQAARALIGATGPVGRKLDFLMQEFNREANTLCSKSGAADLTRIGLDLKAVIDQMREQVQNVE